MDRCPGMEVSSGVAIQRAAFPPKECLVFLYGPHPDIVPVASSLLPPPPCIQSLVTGDT